METYSGKIKITFLHPTSNPASGTRDMEIDGGCKDQITKINTIPSLNGMVNLKLTGVCRTYTTKSNKEFSRLKASIG